MTILPISTDPPPPRILALILVLGLTFSSCSPSSERKSEALPADPSVLKPGAPVVREIGGRESHTYRLSLEPGQYVQLRIDQPGVDVLAKIVGPGGKESPFFDDPRRLEEPDRFALVTTKGGENRVIITARAPEARRGRYRLVLRELTRAGEGAHERVAAELVYRQGRGLLDEKESGETRRRSLTRFQEAFRLWESAGDPTGQVDALIQMAEVRNLLSEWEGAIVAAKRALLLARQERYQEGEARALQALGDTYGRLAQSPKALQFFNQALPLWEQLGDVSRQGTVLYSIALQHGQQDKKRAAELLEEAVPRLRLAGDLSQLSKALVALSGIQQEQGAMSKALKNCQEALTLSKESRDRSAQAVAAFCLGTISAKRGEWEAARRYFDEALAINIKLGVPQYVATLRQALGSVYFNLGNSDRALAEYREALTISREIEDLKLQARLLTNSGWIHQTNGDPEKALTYYRQALPLNEELGNESGIAQTLHNTGVAYTALERAEAGLSSLDKALKLRSRIGERAAQAATLLEIATAHRVLGDSHQAAESFRQAFDLAQSVGSTSLQAECLFRWAVLERDQGALQTALARVEKSLGIIESLRSNVFSDKMRTEFFASKRAYYEIYVDLLMRLEEVHPGQFQEKALEASEMARARGLLDLLTEGNISVEAGIDPTLRQRELDLGARLSSLQYKLDKSTPAQAVALVRQLDQVQGEMEELESEIRRQHRNYADVRYPTPMRFREIQALLDERTALVQYFSGSESSALFVVTREGLESHPLPPEREIAGKVDVMRRILRMRGQRHLRKYQDLAHRLYVELLGPADQILRTKPRLLIAPDGPLYVLPFETLLTGIEVGRAPSYQNLPYLLRRHAVSYIPSASVLRELRTPSPAVHPVKAPKRLVAFADPVYGADSAVPVDARVSRNAPPGTEARKLPRLADSEGEVRQIASLYPESSVEIYLREEATEDNVKRNPLLQTALQVHFATHGRLDETRPQLSGLELSRRRGSVEDGKLQVYEIFNLRLNADLLTLSACETGLGKEVRGEGIIGLTRAFLYAGAKSLLVSLWPVPDHSTPDLMADFYGFLRGSDKAEALRRAKLAMIGSGKYEEPYYWAPFVLAGEPQ